MKNLLNWHKIFVNKFMNKTGMDSYQLAWFSWFKGLIIGVILILLLSCEKKCDCNQSWDSNVTYVKDDLVSYDGKCWIAIAQGKGIEPGPWLQDGNDIWEECHD